MPRCTKVAEFVGHTSNVNCVQLGHKSGQVVVSGGEDRRVNVWKIGRTEAIMSLSGHTSPVECVTFDGEEETIVAGSLSGTIKLWDLNAAKATGTLTGTCARRARGFLPLCSETDH